MNGEVGCSVESASGGSGDSCHARPRENAISFMSAAKWGLESKKVANFGIREAWMGPMEANSSGRDMTSHAREISVQADIAALSLARCFRMMRATSTGRSCMVTCGDRVSENISVGGKFRQDRLNGQ